MRRGFLIFWLALVAVALLAAFAPAQCGPGGCSGGNCGQAPPTYYDNPVLPDVVGPDRWGPSRPLPQAPREDGPARPESNDTLAKAYRAVVRIQTDDGGGRRSFGSGVVVVWGNRLAVLTAAHVVRDARAVWVLSDQGYQRAGVPRRDTVWDVAVLFPATAEGFATARLAYRPTAHPQSGERLYSCGFGPDGTLRVNPGRFMGYRRPSASPGNGPTDWMMLTGGSRSGDSGGPVFNTRGEVVGILWGTDGTSTISVQAGRLHVLMRAALGEPVIVQERETTTVTRSGLLRTVTQQSTVDRTVYQPAQYPTPAPLENAEPARILGREPLIPICRPRTPPAPPQVIVRTDPDVSRKLDVLIQNTTPPPPEPYPDPNSGAVVEEAGPNVGLLIGLAVGAAVVVAFIALRSGLGKSN